MEIKEKTDLLNFEPLQDTAEKLDYLFELQRAAEHAERAENELIDEILTSEIRQKINEIKEEFAPKKEAINEKIGQVDKEIRKDVIDKGETAKGVYLECTYSAGRTSWDTKGLNKAIDLIPQLKQYKKHGNPYATIRARKK